MDDVELVAQARQGDTAAFGELVNRHRTVVYRAALAALGSHADAEDAAQEAFLLAYRRLDSFRGDASFRTWLLAIAWHQAINRRRSLRRMWLRWMGQEGDPFASIASETPTPEESVERRELMRIVRDQVRRLSPKLRDALLLAASGEYSQEEIAAILGAPVGTIKWRIFEARRLLKQRLHEHTSGTREGT